MTDHSDLERLAQAATPSDECDRCFHPRFEHRDPDPCYRCAERTGTQASWTTVYKVSDECRAFVDITVLEARLRAAESRVGAERDMVNSLVFALAITVTHVPAPGVGHWCRDFEARGRHDVTCSGMLHALQAGREWLALHEGQDAG